MSRDKAEYAFLVDRLIDARTLERATAVARRWRVAPHVVLIDLGWLSVDAYVDALADYVGARRASSGLAASPYGTVLRATAFRPDELLTLVRLETDVGRSVLLTAGDARVAQGELPTDGAVDFAVNALRRARPELSAGVPVWTWQHSAVAASVGLLLGAALVAPEEAVSVLLALLSVPFLLVTLLRAVALWHMTFRERRPQSHAHAPPRVLDADLPVYSVLVPLYDEAEGVGELLAALLRLDWPTDRLDIIIVLEASDGATRARLAAETLPQHVRVLVAPAGGPRTKPRAANFALCYARGSFLVVYDAEDVPEPDQLRRAYDRLRSDPERIGCAQARLDIYNPRASWLSRQFTLEYIALFDGLLPTLESLALPLPLGGTSNHFPRHVLEQVGGWDPYNVTEDADLGIRLARLGWRVAVLDSTTWEEAPTGFRVWLRQRTRWLKGWMQTVLVHLRQPRQLRRELGTIRALAVAVVLGGMMMSALVHPWFYVLLAFELWRRQLLLFPETAFSQWLWAMAAVNLLLGYTVAMLLGVAAAMRKGHAALLLHVALLPLYWLAISVAAYRALWQLARAPYLWEKTVHSAHRRRRYLLRRGRARSKLQPPEP